MKSVLEAPETETVNLDTAAAPAPPGPWNDVYMRKAIGDDGTVPFAGVWTASPDIIPNGTTAIDNPQTYYAGNYASDVGQATAPFHTNYFYVRGKNLAAGAATAKFELYYCPANLFLFPSLWNQNQLSTSSGKKQVEATAAATGDVLVGSEPFSYVAPDESIHHCLIARVITPAHPNPLPQDGDIGTSEGLAKFIVDNPNYAWRNVVTVDRGVPTFTHTFTIDTTPVGTGGKYLIGLSYKNLTVGSKVSFSCGTPIPSGPDQGTVIELKEMSVAQRNGSAGESFVTIPAGFKSTVSYSYTAQTPVLNNWSIEFFALQVVDAASADLFQKATPLSDFGAAMESNHPHFSDSESGDGMQGRAVKVGSCMTRSDS